MQHSPPDTQRPEAVAALPAVPAVATPVLPGRRLVPLDVLRGVAILGILMLNIRSFGLPLDAYQSPFVWGDLTRADAATFLMTQVLCDSKFITIFAGLFGIGLLLSSRRLDATGDPFAAAKVQYRRLGILGVVGLVHMIFIWHGDILFPYAMLGMVALLMRHWPPIWLVVAGIGFACVSVFLSGLGFLALQCGSPDLLRDAFPPAAERVETREIAAFTGEYLLQLRFRLLIDLQMQPMVLLLFGWHLLGVMLLGMAAFKTGLIGVGRTIRFHVMLGLVCSIIGFGGCAAMAWWGWRQQFLGPTWEILGYNLWQWPSAIAALGIASLVQAIAMRFTGRRPVRWLAAVGRMAFTNYLAQSVLCTLLFYGHGAGLWGRLGYVELMGVVLVIWAIQITFSVLWLSRFRFGPLEWLWRRLTYGRKFDASAPAANLAA